MSVTSFWASRDLQRQMAQSTRSGRLAGKRFVDHNDHRDKLWFGGVLNVSVPSCPETSSDNYNNGCMRSSCKSTSKQIQGMIKSARLVDKVVSATAAIIKLNDACRAPAQAAALHCMHSHGLIHLRSHQSRCEPLK